MQIKSKRGRRKKRYKMIEERKRRTFVGENGKKKRWTQKHLAYQIYLESEKKIKVTPQHIGAIERGVTNPSYEVLRLLSKVLEMPIEDFFN